ncbi:Vacuolar protein sorting-associated protein 16 [Porites harrisoni]
MKTLIDRLVLRRHYCLAIRICDYWKNPKEKGASRILGHLACYKLLDYEAEAADQVPLLMRMNKDDLALEKAIMSGDTDLVFMVVMHLKDNLIPGEFLMAIRYRPVVLSLHIKYCKDQDRRTIVDLFYQDDQFMNSGNAFVQDSYSEKAIESKIITLSKAQRSYQQGGFQFYSKCILQGDLKAAEQLKKEFKIPDKSHFLKHAWIEAEKYLSMVLPENKVTCYVKLGKYEDAAETVFAQKSEGAWI